MQSLRFIQTVGFDSFTRRCLRLNFTVVISVSVEDLITIVYVGVASFCGGNRLEIVYLKITFCFLFSCFSPLVVSFSVIRGGISLSVFPRLQITFTLSIFRFSCSDHLSVQIAI